MRGLVCVLPWVLVLGCGAPDEGPSAPEGPFDLLVIHARVVTCADGGDGDMAAGWVAVRGGRIAALGEGQPPPEAERVIDAEGRALVPGLIDTHRHLMFACIGAEDEAALHDCMDQNMALRDSLEGLLANGLTTVMSTGDFTPEIFELARRIEEGEVVGPRLVAAGPVFTAPGGHPAAGPVCEGRAFCRSRIAVEVDDPEVARAEVARVVALGADAIKVVIDRVIVPGTTMRPSVFEAIAEACEAVDVPLIVHVGSVQDMQVAVEAGADRMVHAPVYGSIRDAAGVTELLLEREVAVATTVAYSSPASAAALELPWDSQEDYEQVLENIRALQDAGVVVAFGTDNPPWLGTTEFMYEVETLGTILSPREVLESLTVQAARFLGLEHRVGTIERGKRADLLLVDGDPLEDPAALGSVAVVVKQGVVVADQR